MSNKILNHPHKDEIISKLISGESVKEVEEWLRKKHPKSKRLHVSYMTLQKFRKEHLNLEGEVLEDIKNARFDSDKSTQSAEIRAVIASSSAYQNKISEIASSELDVTRKLLEMNQLINSRIEFYFNALNGENSGIKEDKIFLEYLGMYRGVMQDWKKYVEGVADKTVEHNININVINEQIGLLKNVVYEVLQEIQPDLIPIFVEKINSKLGSAHYDTPEYHRYIGAIDAESE